MSLYETETAPAYPDWYGKQEAGQIQYDIL